MEMLDGSAIDAIQVEVEHILQLADRYTNPAGNPLPFEELLFAINAVKALSNK